MKIICIGRNYRAHAEELKNEVPSEPVVFMKPETALLPKGHPFIHPEFTKDLHFEVELVVRINRVGKHIHEEFAHKYYSQIGIGIDFTARDVQLALKAKGLPWEKAKAFDHSAPIGKKWIEKAELPNAENISFTLTKNGEEVQKGYSSDMIFTIDQIISYVSQFFTLKIGDLIFTGTPSGVGKVAKGDVLEASIEGQKLLKLAVR
jgi:2-keto-4-pentenoate hydratase/2-oxohepta-3-ene-1,7-dioic acid hydratase in catechol pathway